MKEIWKDIEGYEGLYQVSNFGRIRSIKHFNYQKVLKQLKNNARGGYMQITLCKNGNAKMFRVHRLVATAFISNPDNLPQVNHKDENKENNAVDNLEWCTMEYNLRYSDVGHRYVSYGLEQIEKMKKPTCQYDRYGNFIKEYACIREAERETGISSKGISRCCRGKQPYCGNFVWRYKDEPFDKYNNKGTSERPVAQYDLNGNFIRKWCSLKEIEKSCGFDHSAISRCCKGITKKSYGYVWTFIN